MQRSSAIVLRRIDFSETSQILHLFTLDAGKIHAIAKGARRRKGSFPSPFDLFTIYDLQRIEKHRGELDLVTASETIRDFPKLRSDYDRYCAASYLLDVTDLLTLEGMKQPEIFDLLESTMGALETDRSPAPPLFRFEARLVSILGHFPRLAECGLCRTAIGGREAFFSCRDGGAVCVRCKPRDPRRVLVPTAVLGALARFGDPRAEVKLNPVWIDPLRRILDDYVRHLAEQEPKSMKFMRAAILRDVRTAVESARA